MDEFTKDEVDFCRALARKLDLPLNTRRLIGAFLRNPCNATWCDLAHYVISGRDTAWQAWAKQDSSAPTRIPHSRQPVWPAIPERRFIKQALLKAWLGT